jgi:hypothetical protein
MKGGERLKQKAKGREDCLLYPGRNRHHILPESRGGDGERQNLILLKTYRHRAWHRLFGTRTLEEAITLLLRVHRAKGRCLYALFGVPFTCVGSSCPGSHSSALCFGEGTREVLPNMRQYNGGRPSQSPRAYYIVGENNGRASKSKRCGKAHKRNGRRRDEAYPQEEEP